MATKKTSTEVITIKPSAMLAMALKELKAFQNKYKMLAELKPLFDVLEDIAQSSEKDVKSK